MPALVTIGIPVCNGRATVADAIRSVFAQSFRQWRLLLVDDGSTDGSLELMRRVGDSRVAVIADGVHRGLVFRLNQMVAMTETPYFARMDCDDMMHPERLQRQ